MSLLDDIIASEKATLSACPMCAVIEATTDTNTKEALVRAANGAVGADRLVEILAGHGYTVGRKRIFAHRKDVHMPDGRFVQ